MLKKVESFFALESAGGIVLVVAAVAALVLANSDWGDAYRSAIATRAAIGIGDWQLGKPVLLWINDAWMAVFFLLVGLEIKRELLEGQLSSRAQMLLPAGAALGGMIAPATIYAAINWADPVALRGWAIPAATDIAFALGVLLLLGKRVPVSLRIFLTAVAIIDDLGAIVVIAFFYTADLSLPMLGAAAVCCAVLVLLNRLRVMQTGLYVAVGMLLWYFVLKSGVHATLAGVATALAIPMRDADGASPLEAAEHALHPWVAFLVLPVFAFVNAGVLLAGVTPTVLIEAIPLGIGSGLVVGKIIGVFGSAALLIRFASAELPEGSTWAQLAGVAMLCGIGFTMSLFIGGLAFAGLDDRYETRVKIGVLSGSLVAALLGSAMLLATGRERQ